eukprot:6026773-Pleurochrysis_carterae.AAC.1
MICGHQTRKLCQWQVAGAAAAGAVNALECPVLGRWKKRLGKREKAISPEILETADSGIFPIQLGAPLPFPLSGLTWVSVVLTLKQPLMLALRQEYKSGLGPIWVPLLVIGAAVPPLAAVRRVHVVNFEVSFGNVQRGGVKQPARSGDLNSSFLGLIMCI